MNRVGVGAAVAAAVAVVVGAAVVGVREVEDDDPPRIVHQLSKCTRQPKDGGICLASLPDGGTGRYGPFTIFSAARATGQCEAPFPCNLDL